MHLNDVISFPANFVHQILIAEHQNQSLWLPTGCGSTKLKNKSTRLVFL